MSYLGVRQHVEGAGQLLKLLSCSLPPLKRSFIWVYACSLLPESSSHFLRRGVDVHAQNTIGVFETVIEYHQQVNGHCDCVAHQ